MAKPEIMRWCECPKPDPDVREDGTVFCAYCRHVVLDIDGQPINHSIRIKIDDPELAKALSTTVWCRCPPDRQDRRPGGPKAVHDWCYQCSHAIPKETTNDET